MSTFAFNASPLSLLAAFGGYPVRRPVVLIASYSIDRLTSHSARVIRYLGEDRTYQNSRGMELWRHILTSHDDYYLDHWWNCRDQWFQAADVILLDMVPGNLNSLAWVQAKREELGLPSLILEEEYLVHRVKDLRAMNHASDPADTMQVLETVGFSEEDLDHTQVPSPALARFYWKHAQGTYPAHKWLQHACRHLDLALVDMVMTEYGYTHITPTCWRAALHTALYAPAFFADRLIQLGGLLNPKQVSLSVYRRLIRDICTLSPVWTEHGAQKIADWLLEHHGSWDWNWPQFLGFLSYRCRFRAAHWMTERYHQFNADARRIDVFHIQKEWKPETRFGGLRVLPESVDLFQSVFYSTFDCDIIQPTTTPTLEESHSWDEVFVNRYAKSARSVTAR